jgi:hypothetical protein
VASGDERRLISSLQSRISPLVPRRAAPPTSEPGSVSTRRSSTAATGAPRPAEAAGGGASCRPSQSALDLETGCAQTTTSPHLARTCPITCAHVVAPVRIRTSTLQNRLCRVAAELTQRRRRESRPAKRPLHHHRYRRERRQHAEISSRARAGEYPGAPDAERRAQGEGAFPLRPPLRRLAIYPLRART